MCVILVSTHQGFTERELKTWLFAQAQGLRSPDGLSLSGGFYSQLPFLSFFLSYFWLYVALYYIIVLALNSIHRPESLFYFIAFYDCLFLLCYCFNFMLPCVLYGGWIFKLIK